MLTQGKIDQFYTDVNSLKLKYPVAEIHRSTGFPKSNISEWLSKKKVPSENFIDVFYDKFKNEIHNSSTSVRTQYEPDIIAVDSKGTVMYIEIKTASGKTVQVKPERQSEITLLNAFLEERDRVIETLKEEKQARIDELLKDKESLIDMLNSALGKIYASQQIALAYQKAWVDYEAEKAAKGDQKKKKELMYKMGKLVDGMIENDAAKGILAETDKLYKEGQ